MPETKLHLVMATHSPGPSLQKTLKALSKCEIPPTFCTTWIVENGSALLDPKLLKTEFPTLRIEYLQLPQACKSAALNLALSYLVSGVVLFADDDIFPFTHWFKAYEQAYQEFPDKFFFGGPFEVVYEHSPLPYVKNFLPRSAHGWRLPFKETTLTPQWFVGFNWAAPVKALKKAGGFSMRFGPGTPGGSTGEETQLQFKLASMGFKSIYVPNAEVLHPVPKSRCNSLFAIKRRRRMALEKILSGSNTNAFSISKKLVVDSIGHIRLLWAWRCFKFKFWCFAILAFSSDFFGLLQGIWLNLFMPKFNDARN